jgi:hypothetical protein
MRVEARLPVDCDLTVSDVCCDMLRLCDCGMLVVCDGEVQGGEKVVFVRGRDARLKHQAGGRASLKQRRAREIGMWDSRWRGWAGKTRENSSCWLGGLGYRDVTCGL